MQLTIARKQDLNPPRSNSFAVVGVLFFFVLCLLLFCAFEIKEGTKEDYMKVEESKGGGVDYKSMWFLRMVTPSVISKLC